MIHEIQFESSSSISPPLMVRLSYVPSEEEIEQMRASIRDRVAPGNLLGIAGDAEVFQLVDGRWHLLGESEPSRVKCWGLWDGHNWVQGCGGRIICYPAPGPAHAEARLRREHHDDEVIAAVIPDDGGEPALKVDGIPD